MPGTVPMLDEATFAALRKGDEQALETLFRSRFASMLGTAQDALHEPARSARAVERAFEIFWKERERLTAIESTEPMLDAILQDEVARLQARSTGNGHRAFAGHGKAHAVAHPAPTVDEAWQRVHAELHPRSAAATASKSQIRHAAAEHMAALGKRRSPVKAIGGAVIAIAAVGAILYAVQHHSGNRVLDVAFASTEVREIVSGPGQRGSTTLSDQTQVALGADTHLVIPPGFPSRLRAVKLDGTASFTLPAAQSLPFIVRTPNGDIQATGTAFDVSAFSDDPTVLLRVREGSVTVTAGGEPRTVSQREAIAIPAKGSMVAATPEQVEQAFSWIDGELVVIDQPMKQVVSLLRRWYDLTLTPENDAMLERTVSFRAGLDSMRAAMRELQASGSVVIDYDGKRNPMRDVGTSK